MSEIDEAKQLIKDIILDKRVSLEIRKRALDGLISLSVNEARNSVSIGDNYYISNFDYAQIVALLQAEKKIAAIKYLRELTTIGLKEAKDCIETIEKKISKKVKNENLSR